MNYLLSLFEKTFWTYVQSVIALVLVGGGLSGGGITTELAVAALPAALTVLANGLPVVPKGLTFWPDLGLRVMRSVAAAFIGYLLAMPVFGLDVTSLRAAGISALVAGLVVVKGIAASKIGDIDSPATLPESVTDKAA